MKATRSSSVPARRRPSVSEWSERFSTEADRLERSIGSGLGAHPRATAGIAIGAGLLAAAWVRRSSVDPSESPKRRSSSTAAASGFLAGCFREELSRIRERFDGIGREPGSREGFGEEIASRPIQFLGAAVTAGFGLGTIPTERLRDEAFRFAGRIFAQAFQPTNPEGGSRHEIHDEE